MTVRIDGYLTQSKLEAALRQIVGDAAWRGREVPVGIGRQRWDMAFDRDGSITAVEYDGDEHYRNALKIKADREKDLIAHDAGVAVVRFPYWIQLTDETLLHFFALTGRVEQDFPHGFITTKLFPASFCELGVERFQRELAGLPLRVRESVVESLRQRSDEHGVEFVLPRELRVLVE